VNARDDYPWDSVTFDNYERMCDEIDALRGAAPTPPCQGCQGRGGHLIQGEWYDCSRCGGTA